MRLLAPPPLPGAIYRASPALVSPPVTPVTPTTEQTGITPTVMRPEKSLPGCSAPKAGEGEEDGRGASVVGRDMDVSMGSSTVSSSSREGGGDDDDEGWGEFESA